jgi:hypothetical protein
MAAAALIIGIVSSVFSIAHDGYLLRLGYNSAA